MKAPTISRAVSPKPTTPRCLGLHPLARLIPHLLTRVVAGSVGLHGVIIPTLVPLFALRHAQAQTAPAAGAPSGQKAIMDAARNGVPIANIAPPSAAGVSRNQYGQFNVGTNGLILNNSAANVQTRLGGWINGNMQLGLVPARVIVNEVVGPNASVLRGAMEVAGPGANIITANPNGLTCDGCSFINTTGRVSLTTGVPQFGANGAVTGFNVPQGVLMIGAGGLSAADLYQLDLIARGIIVAGTVTVNRLNVLAGANQVSYDGLVATTIAGTGTPPSFAVDIKDAGGMYAGQIWLIATEKGLGVNSTGRMSAVQGDLVLSSNGDLTYKDGYAKNALTLTAAGDTAITGQVQADGATGGSLAIATSGQLRSSGTLYSASGLALHAANITGTGGTILAQGDVSLAAQSLQLQGTSVGSNANFSLTALAGDVSSSGSTLFAAGSLNVSGAALDNTNGIINANDVRLSLGAPATPGALINTGGQIIGASSLALQAGAINNAHGVIATGGALSLNTQGGMLNNAGGTLQSGGALTIAAGAMNNANGLITAAGTLDAATTGTLGNAGGTIAAAGAVTLTWTNAGNGAVLTNAGGTIASTTGGLTVAAQGATLANDGGRLQASGDVRIDAGDASSVGGIITGQNVRLNAGVLNNSAGAIAAGAALTLSTQALSNDAGLITAAGDMSIDTHGQALTNTRSAVPVAAVGGATGGIAAGGALTLSTGALNNTAGTLDASDITLNAATLNNTQGAIRAARNAGVNTAALNNSAGLVSAKGTLNLSAPSVSNTGGTLTGEAGLTLATGSAALATMLDGTLGSNAGITLTIAGDYNNAATLSTQGSLTLNARDLSNSGTLHSDAALTANVRDLTNTGEISSQTTTINAAGTVTNSGAGLIDGTTTTVNAAAVHNTGRIYGDTLTLNAAEISNDGAGVIAARDSLLIATQNLSNTNGALIYAINDIQLGGSYDATSKTVSGSAASVTNTHATIEAGRDLALSALAINNRNTGVTTTVMEVSRQPGKDYQSDNGGAFHTDYDWFVTGATPAPCNPTGTNPASYSLNGFKPYMCGTTPTVAYDKANPAAWGTRAYVDPVDINTVTVADYTRWGVTAPGPQATSVEINAAVIAVVNAITAYNLSVESDYGLYGCCHYYEYNYTQVTRQTQLTSSQPGKILSGRDMTLTGTTVNDASQIVAGAALHITGPAVNNVGVPGTNEVDTENGQVRLVTPAGPGAWQAYTRAPVISNIDLPAYTYLQNSKQTAGYSAARSTTVGTPVAAANANNHPVTLPVIHITSVPGTGAAGLVVLTTLPALTVPSSALFTQHADAGARYLVETDPRFTSQRAFLSSDYYLAKLNQDPERTLKRYGDGFFEQQEINDQILALTGRRYLADYTSTEAEYRALMDAGVAFAKAFQIAPGVSLSAEQMALLTTDVVLLTEQTVTLTDGSTQQVLVPQVYLRKVQDGDLTQSAGLISGRDVTITTAGDLVNAGQITGNSASLSAGNDIVNKGRVEANVVIASAARDLSNLGGVIAGTGTNSQVNLLAGRDILLRTTTNSASVSGPNGAVNSVTNVDRVATISGASIASYAGRDIVVAGASVNASGAVTLNAARDVAITGVATGQSVQTILDAKNHSNRGSTQDVGSAVNAGGDINVRAGQDIAVKGSALQSANGAINAQAGRDISITEGRQTETTDFARESKSKGLFSSTATTVRAAGSQDSAVGSAVSGASVSLQSGRDALVRGSSVLADQDVNITAQGKVDIVAAQNAQAASNYRNEQTSGLFSSGGLSLTLGKREQSLDQQTTGTGATASTVGAISGNVNIKAGSSYTQTGSDVQAPAGDVSILAKSVRIDEARETSTSQTEQQFKQSGLTVAVTSPVITAVQTVRQMASAAGKTNDGRMQALAAASSALAVKNAASAVQAGQGETVDGKPNQIVTRDAAGNITSLRDATVADKVGGINVAISLGSARSQSTSASQSDTARGSSVTAGGNVNIRATGDGENSNVVIQGSTVNAGNTVDLQADNKVQLLAAQNTASQTSRNSSSSGSVGITFGTSGFGVTAAASQGKGSIDVQDTGYSNTHVQGSQVNIKSGGDTDIKGAVVTANTVKADIKGNFNVESLQDTSSYKEASKSIGGSVTIGPAANFSLNASKTDINSNYASVAEQSGIRAGDGGFQVNVQGASDLKGGAVTSTQKAVDAGTNVFNSAGGITTSDIQNSASYKGSGYSVGASIGMGTDPAGRSVPGGSAGVGNQSGTAASTTQAAISGVAGNKDARTGDAEMGIKPIFDAQKVRDEVNAQVAITAEFGRNAAKAIGDYASQQLAEAKKLSDQAATESDPARKAQLNAQAATLNSDWGDNGTLRVAAHALVGGLTGGLGGAAGAAAGTLTAPVVAQALSDAGIAGPLAQTLTALASTSAGAALGGGAGAGAAFNEVTNNYLKHDEINRLLVVSAKCVNNDEAACKERDALQALSAQRDAALSACSGVNSQQCNGLRLEVLNTQAEIIRKTPYGPDTVRAMEIARTESEALKVLSTSDRIGGMTVGFVQATAEGVAVLAHGIATITSAALGNETARDSVGQSVDALVRLSDPETLARVISSATAAQRENLALAYEAGDAFLIGKIGGEVLASLPVIPAGSVKNVGAALRTADQVMVEAATGAKAAIGVAERGSIGNAAKEVVGAGANSGFDTSNLQSKLQGYLLDASHPQNQAKATWFQQALGFDKSNWQQLGAQIAFNESAAVATKTTQYGQTFEQLMPITGVNGKTIEVLFVFIKDNTGTVRLVTGIPARK